MHLIPHVIETFSPLSISALGLRFQRAMSCNQAPKSLHCQTPGDQPLASFAVGTKTTHPPKNSPTYPFNPIPLKHPPLPHSPCSNYKVGGELLKLYPPTSLLIPNFCRVAQASTLQCCIQEAYRLKGYHTEHIFPKKARAFSKMQPPGYRPTLVDSPHCPVRHTVVPVCKLYFRVTNLLRRIRPGPSHIEMPRV